MISCLFYEIDRQDREVFSISELTTLESTQLLENELAIESIKIFAYRKDAFLDELTSSSWRSVADFNRYFINNPGFYIHDCEILLSNGWYIMSHDDGEVHFHAPFNDGLTEFVQRLLIIKGVPHQTLESAKAKPGYYLKIGQLGEVIYYYQTFEAYIQSL